MKKVFLAAAFSTIFFVFPLSAKAANVDLTVSPVYFDLNPKPGDVIKDKIRVHNNTGTPMPLTISVNTMTINERGDIVPQALPTQDSTGWFKFPTTQITVPANEWLDVPFTANVPGDAAFGNYFAVSFAPGVTKVAGSNAVIQGNIVVPMLINVQKAGSVAQASIASFKVDNFVSEYQPVTFTVDVKNTGNVHLKPRGNIFIRGPKDKDLAVLEVNSAQGNVLPGANRAFSSQWADGFIVKEPVMENGNPKIDDQGKPVTHIVINWNKLTSLRIGKYSAYVLMVYDNGQRDIPIESTVTFWIFPYTAVAITLVVLIVLFVGISTIFKTIVKSEAKKLRSS